MLPVPRWVPNASLSYSRVTKKSVMRKLTGAIIGCGTIAREHLAALSQLENVQIGAVCDLSAARAEATAERFGVEHSDIRPDLVHITTPPASHFSIAKDCLATGCNLLCEKPITLSYEEFCVLKELASKNHCLLLENQNYRFHSSVRRICDLLKAGAFGDIIDVQIFLSLDIFAPKSPYMDQNAPYFGHMLRGGLIGDFLTHIAYLAYIFTGPVIDLRTIWTKRTQTSNWPADEFRAFLKGERATAYVAFSGNAQPDGFWLRVTGTKMHVEANLFEPPRLTTRMLRSGEPALAKLFDGVVEARDVFASVVTGFWKKLAGLSQYDGLAEIIANTYRALERREAPPISLEEIEEIVRLVDRFSKTELKL
jgi:predicted dehydrogenase